MTTKKLLKRTRPFQPFFLAAEDLLRFALPYYQQVQGRVNTTGMAGPPDATFQEVWRKDKSASLGSFLTMYSGLEALVTCAHRDFRVRQPSALPNVYYSPLPPKQIKKMLKKSFNQWSLGSRVRLLAPLCSDPVVEAGEVFDTSSIDWKKFAELIEIRHSFAHADVVEDELLATQVAHKAWNVDDQFSGNFWPLTQVPRDHRNFNYECADGLNRIVEWVVKTLRAALPNQLNKSYMANEDWILRDD